MTLINTTVSGGTATNSGGNISVANSAKLYFKSGRLVKFDMTGGTLGATSFEGKRYTFSVGGFHSSLFDKTHVYRVDVLDQNGVVFSQEISAEETSYFAFDANNESNYYYIEIYDVTEDSMIAIGNPIWNEK